MLSLRRFIIKYNFNKAAGKQHRRSVSMVKRKFTIWIFLFFVAPTAVCAQNSFSVSNRLPQYMVLVPGYYQTESPQVSFQYTQWINYITLTDPYDPCFSITVQMVRQNAPVGLRLEVKADPYKGLSKGEVGTPTGMKQVLQDGARVLIDNIRTSYTGNGRGQGHLTTLYFTAPGHSAADTTSYRVNVIYTLVQ